MFAQETAAEIVSRWDDLAASLAERFPEGPTTNQVKENMLAFRHSSKGH